MWRSRDSLGTTGPDLWVVRGQLDAQAVDLLVVHSLWRSFVHESTAT